MTRNIVFDAAYPPATAPPIAAGVMGYIAGRRATNIWTPKQWQPFSHLPQFPATVPEVGTEPGPQALELVNAAIRLGWAAHLPEPDTRAVIIDMETWIDAEWYAAMASTITDYGFVPVAYGSLSTVTGNNASNLIIAHWDDVSKIPAGQDMNGIQYLADQPWSGTQVDYSLFDSWLMGRGGLGARHGA